jgi:hypothetical protein
MNQREIMEALLAGKTLVFDKVTSRRLNKNGDIVDERGMHSTIPDHCAWKILEEEKALNFYSFGEISDHRFIN